MIKGYMDVTCNLVIKLSNNFDRKSVYKEQWNKKWISSSTQLFERSLHNLSSTGSQRYTVKGYMDVTCNLVIIVNDWLVQSVYRWFIGLPSPISIIDYTQVYIVEGKCVKIWGKKVKIINFKNDTDHVLECWEQQLYIFV